MDLVLSEEDVALQPLEAEGRRYQHAIHAQSVQVSKEGLQFRHGRLLIDDRIGYHPEALALGLVYALDDLLEGPWAAAQPVVGFSQPIQMED